MATSPIHGPGESADAQVQLPRGDKAVKERGELAHGILEARAQEISRANQARLGQVDAHCLPHGGERHRQKDPIGMGDPAASPGELTERLIQIPRRGSREHDAVLAERRVVA